MNNSIDNIKRPGPNNPLALFIKSLSDDEKKTPVMELKPDRVIEYIKSMFEFQLEAIPDLEKNASKSLLIILHELNNNNLEKLDISMSFMGTKDEVKEENFSLHIKSIENVEDFEKSPTYFKNDERPSHEKINLFINQKENILSLVNRVKNTFSKSKDSSVVLVTAGLISIFEYLSVKDISEISVITKGLVKGDEVISKNYYSLINREELEFEITHRVTSGYKN